MKVAKGKTLRLHHEKETNQWFLIQRWKKRGDCFEAVDPIDVSEEVNVATSNFSAYVRRVENAYIDSCKRIWELENPGKTLTESAVISVMADLDIEANGTYDRKHPSWLTRGSGGALVTAPMSICPSEVSHDQRIY